MKRAVSAALFAALLVPCAASAQGQFDFDRPVWGPRIRVTPFIAFGAASSRLERWTVTSINGTAQADFDVDLASGPAAGIAVEIQAIERFAIIASGAFLSRGRTIERSVSDGVPFEHGGSNFVFGKAALAMRLREQVSELQVHTLSGTIFVGPAFVREMPKTDIQTPAELLVPMNHFGVSFGVDAEIPLPYNALSFTAGLEDYVIWWNTAELARRNDAILAGRGFDTRSFVESDPTHSLLFRVGLSLRFQ